MTAQVFDDRACLLGEGPLWHPDRAQLFWFDIMGKRLMTRSKTGPDEWRFDRHVSAAGWIDHDSLVIATETGLIRFDLRTGAETPIATLEADQPQTRSNDGRIDPFGGFWIGTMGKHAEQDAGAIYRYHKGEMRRLFAPITIPNAICFAPDGGHAYFADTAQHLVWRVALDRDGWPMGEAKVFLDHIKSGVNPDGAVVDAAGRFICAEWGSARVAIYAASDADGQAQLVEEYPLPARQPSCPSLGGAGLSTLYVTTARQGLGGSAHPEDGMTFCIETTIKGLPEPRFIP